MRPHRFDPISFLSGVLFTAVGLLFLLPLSISYLVTMVLDLARWVLPALALLAGGVVVATTLVHRSGAGEGEEELEH